MMDSGDDAQAEQPEDNHSGPARELTLHLIHMLETRADAAGIALQSEIESFKRRLQLRVVAGASIFLAAWAGIVLLAIVLPPDMRVPVLSAVVGLLVIGAAIALVLANRNIAAREVGSMAWFVDGLKRDFEVFSRALEKADAPAPATEERSPNELAA